VKIVQWIALVAIGASSLGAGPRDAARSNVAQALIGTWSLESRRDRTLEGVIQIEPSLGEKPLGLLVYDAKGHVAVQLMKRDRSTVTFADAPTPAQNSGGTNSSAGSGSYDAYFGTYTVDAQAGTVTHHLDAALSPADVGRTLTRHFELTGNELTLSFQTTVGSGAVVTRVIVWHRVG
jgi:Lipocalin-like domain